MLFVYIINIFIYSVFGSVLVRFSYFRYKNIGTVRVFEGIGLVSGISVQFFGLVLWFGLFCAGYLNPLPPPPKKKVIHGDYLVRRDEESSTIVDERLMRSSLSLVSRIERSCTW